MNLKEIGCEAVDWIYIAQDMAKWWGCCEHDNELSGSIKR
jgi:hypothetical protein